MGDHKKIQLSDLKDYSFGATERTFSIACLGIGAVLAIIGGIMAWDNPARIFSALIYNNFFFLLLGLLGAFFVASQTLGYNGWYVMVKRISEAIAMFVPIGSILMAIILFIGYKSVYIWAHPGYMDTASPMFDAILKSKEPYLNVPFFFIRMAIYLGLWTLCVLLIRRNSISIDKDNSLSSYNKSKLVSAFFIVVFAVSTSMSSWDWLMSIQPHWYSTLFGWYCFISMFVTSMAVTILICLFLKSKGYLPLMNDDHFHDLGKFMFAFSVAWAYLFYAQFMLIWYGNIPEETMYYRIRIEHYSYVMWGCVLINFVAPFMVLMTAGAKKNKGILAFAACIIIFGHWMDFYQMAVPGAVMEAAHHAHAIEGGHHAATATDAFIQTVGDKGHEAAGHAADAAHGAAHGEHHVAEYVRPGIYELGLFIFYIGLFSYIVFSSLAKAPLQQVNHPFFRESMVHHT